MAANDGQLVPDASLKREMYSVEIVFLVLAILSVCGRYWARYRSVASFGADDWLVLASLILLFVTFAMNAIMFENGLGLPADRVPMAYLITIGKALFSDTILYLIILATIKVAILHMYCRVFPIHSFRLAARILSVVTCIWSLMFVLLCVFQCTPVAKAWDPNVQGKCMNLRMGYIGNAIPNILTDVVMLLMPLYHVWHLQIKLAQRIAVSCIFLLGAFVIVASAYRFSRILKVDPADLSYTLKQPTMWSFVEVSVALICACLPMMKPLLAAFLHMLGIKRSNKTGQSTPTSANLPSTLDSKRRPCCFKKKMSEFSVLDEEERSDWNEGTNESTEQLPVHSIHIAKAYEQRVEITPVNSDVDRTDVRTKKLWYPGRGDAQTS